MGYGREKFVKCLECGEEFKHTKRLSDHLKSVHKMSGKEYTVKHYYEGKQPLCPKCGEETRYVKLGEYRKYCVKHAKLAMSKAGKRGGSAPAWNKGLTKKEDERLRKLSERLKGSNNPFYGQTHDEETIARMIEKKRLTFDEVVRRIEETNKTLKVLSSSDDYKTQNSLLEVECTRCKEKERVSLFNLQRCWRCRTCHPIGSRSQIEVYEFVKSLGVSASSSCRTVISPMELDIWIPEHKIAIEYHGLYWHSGGKNDWFDRKLHRRKYEECTKKGIRLIQFFSDEWIDHRDICESMLQNALGMTETKLNARDCQFIESTTKETKPFFERTHIQGSTRARHHFVLKHPVEGVVAAASFRAPIQKKWGENLIELARLSFKTDVSVRGGVSKLLKNAERELSDRYSGILTYVELRHGVGTSYEKSGFTRVGETSSINYWYTDGRLRYDRFKFRAQGGKSEKIVAEEAGVRPISGCGNAVYIKEW